MTKLTRTFRFGESIGRVANGVLYIKEHSEQTREKNQLWVPYRITPSDVECTVTTEKLQCPKTVIGRTNYALAQAAWELLDEKPGIRIALNGDGEGAGRNKFSTVFSQLSSALDLYHGQRPTHGPLAEYSSWSEFKADVEERE